MRSDKKHVEGTSNDDGQKKFKIHFNELQFADLRNRLKYVRMFDKSDYKGWELGTPDNFLKYLIGHWAESYDWSITEDVLNSYPQYIWNIAGMNIHYFHIKSKKHNVPTILMAHGWPDSFLRYYKTFPFLCNFNLVVPSMPGFGFSTLPSKGYFNNSEVADLWHRLMTEVLGYKEYFATGGDMGRGVVCFLAARYPEMIKGIHLTDVGLVKEIMTADDSMLDAESIEYKRNAKNWLSKEGAYINIQSTKPFSLGYALADSPAGMAAWLIEKFHDWSDWQHFNEKDLLDNLTLYWMTGCAATSIRQYYGNSFTLPPIEAINVPVAVARFPQDILPAPRKWIEKMYPLVQYSDMTWGGHFTAMENPEEFSTDLSAFINKIFG